MVDGIDAAGFARTFQRFMERYLEALGGEQQSIRHLVAEHLGQDPSELPVVTERLDPSEHANLQLALGALLESVGEWRLLGLPAELRHYGSFSLASVIAGRFYGPANVCAPEFLNVAVDVDTTLPCLRLGVYLLRFDGAPLVAMVGYSDDRHGDDELVLDVAGADTVRVAAFLRRVRTLMHEHNVYRGKVLSFTFSEWGRFGVTFHPLPAISRDDIVLPAADLDAIERHTVAISEHADALRAAGRHVKRGLLLYGPPGTGKTLSVMYLCARMPGRTTLLLNGLGTRHLGQAAAIARSLQPSTIVLEDVDLVAFERTMGDMDCHPLLFQLLDAMDGLAEDADVVFVLTTNRVELLEPALANRPGRIDQAVEIRLPDPACRHRLFELYLRGVDHEVGSLDEFVDRTKGITASFVKELVRRAVLLAADAGDAGEAGVRVTRAQLASALDDLLEHSAPVLRSTLGVGGDA